MAPLTSSDRCRIEKLWLPQRRKTKFCRATRLSLHEAIEHKKKQWQRRTLIKFWPHICLFFGATCWEVHSERTKHHQMLGRETISRTCAALSVVPFPLCYFLLPQKSVISSSSTCAWKMITNQHDLKKWFERYREEWCIWCSCSMLEQLNETSQAKSTEIEWIKTKCSKKEANPRLKSNCAKLIDEIPRECADKRTNMFLAASARIWKNPSNKKIRGWPTN